ncbi:unnamed protein product [Zymoseptoria tritici ST99CH_3D7]|uniref:Protein kinase domain-containing protein n=1 Tax=Zymoseptoria tritici (strain ST99CH_3D7) TaxID=1276538 RepID=A0A1X7RCC4_ZYMT9|nr:unnamed protein product [Zymoseptoria tritici ST99CH_3D7]
MPRADDLVRLARLDATVTEDQIAVHTRHDNHGTPTVWKRSLRPIGQGGFGAVYREECIEGRNRGSLRAVKAVQKVIFQGSPQMDYSKELEAIARFSQLQYQQHFVRSFGWYENASTIFIAMEFVEHGDLQQYVGRAMPEPEMQLIVSQVLEGLSHMHNLSYAHRDLKPANLLVYRKGPQWHVKIADFGLSKRLTESLSSLHTRAGTHGFMAPEILGLLHDDDEDSDTESGPSYTNAVDVWALGVITFQLLTTQLPFAAGDFRPLRKYVKGKAPFTQEHLVASRISFSGIAWIESCLAPSPAQRPSAGFSRKHRWPIGALITESAHPLPRTVDSESLASASWSVQDSGYETASRHLSTTPPQQLGQSMRANAQLSDGSSVFDGEHDAHPWVEVTNMEIERAERPIFSQHGHLAVLSDSLLHIWDATGAWKSKKLADLPGYHSPYESGTAGNPPHSCNIESFSPDGRHIAICTGSGTIVWNTVTWESVKMFNETLNGNGASLFVRFSSDGRLLVSGDEDHKVDEKSLVVKLWDTASWTVVKQLRVKQLGRSIYFIRKLPPDDLTKPFDGFGLDSKGQKERRGDTKKTSSNSGTKRGK